MSHPEPTPTVAAAASNPTPDVATAASKPARKPKLPRLEQAESLARSTWADPTEQGIMAARRQLARWMWRARAAGEQELRASLRRIYGRLLEQQRTHDWEIDGTERRRRQRTRHDERQYRREQAQRQAVQDSTARAALRDQQRQRDLDRYRANCLAHALWALHQGSRDWTPLPISSTSSTRPPADQPVGRPLGAAYLEVAVPETQFGPACTLRLFRADYDELLDLWGYHRVSRANRLRDKLRGTSSGDDLAALHALALDSARHPNLALSWHSYVTGSRLGDVFYTHIGGRMQLSPNRSGDLREALMEVYAQCQAVAY